MRRDYLDLGFTLVLLALISWTTYEASKWDARARLFPWAAGIPVLVLLVIQLIRQVPTVLASRADGAAAASGDPEEARRMFRRTLNVGAWILGFALMIWVIGFALGGTLATLLYLKVAAREKWPISLSITVGTAAFFWILTTYLYVPFPRGFIVDLLPI